MAVTSNENDSQFRRMVEEGSGDIDEGDIDGEDGALREVFGKEDVTHGDRSEEEKLQAAAIGAEGVVDDIREHQQRVGGANRKCPIGSARQESAARAGPGRRNAKESEDDDGHYKHEKNRAAAHQVTHFLFENCGDGSGEAAQIPTLADFFARADGGRSGCFAEIFAQELSAKTAIHERGEQGEINGEAGAGKQSIERLAGLDMLERKGRETRWKKLRDLHGSLQRRCGVTRMISQAGASSGLMN